MPPRKDSASSDMRYVCDQPDCTKSYSRPDHLLRHKLNHVQHRVLCCDQCDRTFVRQDLLVRHLERHALRGKTLGRWSNRSQDGTAARPKLGNRDESQSTEDVRPQQLAQTNGTSPRAQTSPLLPPNLDVTPSPTPWFDPSTLDPSTEQLDPSVAHPPSAWSTAYTPQRRESTVHRQHRDEWLPRDRASYAPSPSAIYFPQHGMEIPPTVFPFAPPNNDHNADYGWLFDGVDPFARTTGEPVAFSPNSSDSGLPRGTVSSAGRESVPLNALEDLAFFASMQAEIPAAFDVDALAHSRLLIFLQSVTELPNSPLFTPSALRCYIHLFFAKFNRLYPLIHEPTFLASTTDSMLLSAIVVIGAHFAGMPAHELAVRIAQKIWGAIVSLEDFRPARATLPMLQAMVLTEAFGKLMSTRPQHEMAHLFHNFIVTLARRNAVFNNSSTPAQSNQSPDEAWRNWAREEEKKRIALFEFMLDAQHATMFRHIPCLSSFQIQLDLPCSHEEWSRTNAETWQAHRAKPPRPFIAALKACLSPGVAHHQELDAFARIVLLHGLMSIAHDLQWKQNVLLGAESSSGDWKRRLSAAYASLQADMEVAEEVCQLTHSATSSLLAAAQIALFVDMIDIQIYAGLPSVLGRFIDRNTFSASRRSVKEWAKTPDARTAVWYAVRFLRSSLLDQPSANAMNGVDELLHHRWCHYQCALIIWAHGHALCGPSQAQRTAMPALAQLAELGQEEEERPIPTDGADFLIRMSTAHPEEIAQIDCKSNTKAVLQMVEKELRASRWELGREASGVLRKLNDV